jgi:glycosyltransferase involved in cell wall biosynthesis
MREVRGFVQHSLVAPDGDSEGSPVAVMEAQLSGLPVVATRHAGIPEVVLEGESGFLVDEGDVAAMAVAIAKLIKDPALAARLGDCGRRRVLEGFTIDHHLRQVSGLVLKVIEESSS